ncbi:hypothetical protein N9N28_02430 [Rubripirellula amarantea]|nr:hypothetical protein [Rubripirellula amarantea]
MKSLYAVVIVTCSMLAGCMPTASQADKTKESTTPGVTAEEATPREIIGKTTQNVLVLEEAIANGAVLASTSVETSNPLLASAGAYRTSVGKIGGMGVEKAIQLRNASSIRDPEPLDHPTFMAEIIKPGSGNGIRLPMLPYYQEYAWDEPNQKLVVVDFPARKEERAKQR